MTQMKIDEYTPGKWVDTPIGRTVHHIEHAKGEIATVWGTDRPEGVANARLIAAAPELLLALRAIIEIVTDEEDSLSAESLRKSTEFRRAIAAISKATNTKPQTP